jgi:hypothetical protein
MQNARALIRQGKHQPSPGIPTPELSGMDYESNRGVPLQGLEGTC